MTIIPELEKALKDHEGFEDMIWTSAEEDTLFRYYGKVKTSLLAKFIPRHTVGSFHRKYKWMVKKGYRLIDGKVVPPGIEPEQVPADKSAEGLSEGNETPEVGSASDPSKYPPGTVPQKKEEKKSKLSKTLKKKGSPRPKNGGSDKYPRWTSDEKAAIDGCKDKAAAIKAFREKFPDSERNDNAVGMQWYTLDRKAKKAAKQKKKDAKSQKTAKNVEKPPAAPSQSDCDKITVNKAPASELVTGLKVRQVIPWLGKQFHGNGTIVAREQEGAIICVRNGGHKVHKVGAHCLELVPAGEAMAEKKVEKPAETPGEIKPGDTVEYSGLPRAFSGTGTVTKVPEGHQEVVVQVGRSLMTINRSNLAKVA